MTAQKLLRDALRAELAPRVAKAARAALNAAKAFPGHLKDVREERKP